MIRAASGDASLSFNTLWIINMCTHTHKHTHIQLRRSVAGSSHSQRDPGGRREAHSVPASELPAQATAEFQHRNTMKSQMLKDKKGAADSFWVLSGTREQVSERREPNRPEIKTRKNVCIKSFLMHRICSNNALKSHHKTHGSNSFNWLPGLWSHYTWPDFQNCCTLWLYPR